MVHLNKEKEELEYFRELNKKVKGIEFGEIEFGEIEFGEIEFGEIEFGEIEFGEIEV